MTGLRKQGISGISEVVAKLDSVKRKVGGENVRDAVLPAAKIIRKAAKQKAPIKTGKLKKSIKIKKKVFDDTDRAAVYVAVTDPKGHLLEYGHKVVSPKKKGKAGSGKDTNPGGGFDINSTGLKFVAARPYFRPAIQESEAEVFNSMAEETKKLLQEFGLQ